jgi:hypothetical protein
MPEITLDVFEMTSWLWGWERRSSRRTRSVTVTVSTWSIPASPCARVARCEAIGDARHRSRLHTDVTEVGAPPARPRR